MLTVETFDSIVCENRVRRGITVTVLSICTIEHLGMLILRSSLMLRGLNIRKMLVSRRSRQVLSINSDRLGHCCRCLRCCRRVEILFQSGVHFSFAPCRQLTLFRLTVWSRVNISVLPRSVALAPGRSEIKNSRLLLHVGPVVRIVDEHGRRVRIFLKDLLERFVHASDLLAHVLVQLRALLYKASLTILLKRACCRHGILLKMHWRYRNSRYERQSCCGLSDCY